MHRPVIVISFGRYMVRIIIEMVLNETFYTLINDAINFMIIRFTNNNNITIIITIIILIILIRMTTKLDSPVKKVTEKML